MLLNENINTIKTTILLFLFIQTNHSLSQQNENYSNNTFADSWKFVGVVVKEPGYTICSNCQ